MVDNIVEKSEDSTDKSEKTLTIKSTTKPRTEAQLKHTETMRLKRLEKKSQEEDPNSHFLTKIRDENSTLTAGILYDMERRRKDENKDRKWQKLIDERFSNFETKFFGILEEPVEEFSRKRKRTPKTMDESPSNECEDVTPLIQNAKSEKINTSINTEKEEEEATIIRPNIGDRFSRFLG